MAGNGLLPVDNAIFIGFFYGAFGVAFFIKNHIGTLCIIHQRSNQISFKIKRIGTLFLDGLDSFWAEIRLYFRINFIQNTRFFFMLPSPLPCRV